MWSFASLLLTALEQTVSPPLLPFSEVQQLILALSGVTFLPPVGVQTFHTEARGAENTANCYSAAKHTKS